MRSYPRTLLHLAGCAVFLATCVTAGTADSRALPQNSGLDARGSRPGWLRRETASWRLPGGARIRALNEPKDSPVLTRDQARAVRPAEHTRKLDTIQVEAQTAISISKPSGEVSAFVIHSPPVDGFVPWVTVLATDKNKYDEWTADPSFGILGNFLVPNPQTAYAMGLLDTGAGVSVMSYAAAEQLGLFSHGFNTGGTIAVGGVTGSVDAWVSQPFGLWMTGLDHVNSDLSLNMTGMVGEWNVSVAMGQQPDPGMPDLVTAIGSPMAVYFASWIRNDTWRAIERDGVTYEGPDITFHNVTSAALPSYPYRVPLQLRPAGAAGVWYWPCLAILGEPCPGGDGSPQIPSVILGSTAQSLFFASSVSLSDNGHPANNQTKFMLDTGAQVTVIGSTVAAQLGLNPAYPEFTVEIQGVDGQIQYSPGFYIDTLDVPALGQWLSYTQVPVVLLDIDSPEGGTLDGILGMNLFTRYNLILRGGGLPGLPTNPALDFMPLLSINADSDGDGDVDMTDFAYLQICLSGRDVPQTDPYCSGAFLDGDSDVDSRDMQLFINCANGPSVPAVPECLGQ